MKKINTDFKIGLSDYALKAYISLTANHPVNGSQLSRHSGVPRARIYDVLETLIAKGFVIESDKGVYTPIPSKEFIRRIRHDFERALLAMEREIEKAQQEPEKDVIWTIKGYEAAMDKALEMVKLARTEIYIRLSPKEGKHLDREILKAESRGVEVKYISMEPLPHKFKYQITHPEPEKKEMNAASRFFDIVVDKEEILCGMFTNGDDQGSVINWGQNKRFVLSGRDSLRHDFFHYFLHKIKNEKKELTPKEQKLYEFILQDV